jgi:hypothetical protein
MSRPGVIRITKGIVVAVALQLLQPVGARGRLFAQDTTQVPTQVTTSRSVCDGARHVTNIVVRPAPPPFAGAAAKWRAMARAVGLHHATTRSRVIEAFMALHVGRPCTEFRRAESERVLRAQPYLADAVVKVMPDTGDGVLAIVETTDEIPVLIGGSFRGVVPNALTIGNGNIGGQGLRVQAAWERGRAYRTGYGARVVEYAAFNHPYVLSLEGFQHRQGYGAAIEMAHPFFTDLQRVSWNVSALSVEDYQGIARPARDNLALRQQQQRWEVGGILRIFGTKTVGLLGAATTGLRSDLAREGIIVSDSGFMPDTGIALRDRYRLFKTTRVGAILGLRRIDYETVIGFDALAATQDVAKGVEGALFVARGLGNAGESDFFLSGATYAGVASSRIWLANVAEVEARRDLATGEWNSVVGSTRTALYVGGPGRVLIVADELSGGYRSVLPLQVSFADRLGGLRGYRNTAVAGAARNVARAEARWSAKGFLKRSDIGVAAFGEVGSLWKGDVPYGWTGTRSSIGIGLLAAYPSRSKRLYRVDLAFPLVTEGIGGGRIELRFSSEDRTSRFWEEPLDVARARTGTAPAALFAWPTR